MVLNATLIILGCTIVIGVFRREIGAPQTLFSIIWFLVLFLYKLRMFDIYGVENNTLTVIFAGCVCFIFGCLFGSKIKLSDKKYQIIDANDNTFVEDVDLNDPYVNYKFLRIFVAVIVVLGATYYVPNIIIGLRQGSFDYIKGLLMSGEQSVGGVLMQYIVRPFERIIIALSTYCVFRNRKEKFIIALGIIIVLFELLGMWSKSAIIFYFLCLAVAFLINRDVVGIIQGNKGVLAVVGIGAAIFFISAVGFEGLYFYLCGCVPMLDKILNQTFYLSDGYTYGFVTFQAVIRLVVSVLERVGFKSELFNLAEDYYFKFETTTRISPTKYYNAFHTMFGDFYVDFGFAGVIVLSFLFGILSIVVYRNYKRTNSMLDHATYCIVVYYIIFSIVRFQMSNTFWGLALFYLLTIMKLILYHLRIGDEP